MGDRLRARWLQSRPQLSPYLLVHSFNSFLIMRPSVLNYEISNKLITIDNNFTKYSYCYMFRHYWAIIRLNFRTYYKKCTYCIVEVRSHFLQIYAICILILICSKSQPYADPKVSKHVAVWILYKFLFGSHLFTPYLTSLVAVYIGKGLIWSVFVNVFKCSLVGIVKDAGNLLHNSIIRILTLYRRSAVCFI